MPSFVAKDESDESKSVICDNIPEHCPVCHKKNTPELKQVFLHTKYYEKSLQIIFRCSEAKCRSVFIAYYRGKYEYPPNFYFMYSKPQSFLRRDFYKIFENISNNFVIIYNQSYVAEQLGLSAICGAGYRKALEFLIKDYLIFKEPGIEKIIKKEINRLESKN